jgi:hypothetical protein
MHRAERLLVYPVLAVLCAAVFLRLAPVTADAPADAVFGSLTAQTITVREVQVVGADGTVLARLSSDEDGGTLAIGAHPEKGKGGVLVDTLGGGGRAYTRNADGADVAYLGTTRDTQVGLLYVCAKDGAKMAETTAGEKGGYTMVYGAGGKAAMYSGAASDTGSGIVIVWSKDGVRGGELAYGEKGGYVSTTAEDGKQSAFLGTATDTPVGLLSLHQAGGTRTMLLHGTAEGASIRCLKSDGTEVLHASAGALGGRVALTDAAGTLTLPLRK